jgi:DNA-binding SARP family transcriptional activator
VAGRAIAAEPLRESAYRILTEIHLAEGDAGAARHRYEEYRHLLDGELGLRPSARFELLVATAPDGHAARRDGPVAAP